MVALVDSESRQSTIVSMEVPVLETPRLILRPTRAEDFDNWASMMADPQSVEYVGGVQSRPLAWRGFVAVAGAWMVYGHSMFSVIEKETGLWVGRVGPWIPDGWPGNEVGWAIMRERWRRGYAVEAATAAIDWAFETLGWDEVLHTINPRNLASKAVARRLGARMTGVAPLPEPMPQPEAEFWRQTREEWRARRSAGRSA
ncbi:GNAT family N-acetyltransferase [Azospirillum picis]|uniref:RimJ/RimL family protein N-acetyltransferase n=1 Tax=Azospirillum picis TaxID=488438 RepID=A0ABU0MKT2_9PROT|nr:GNAT family N-acetyltransferase [Azospirillum picis]MBP2300083.1 RimJ/RimL family protein N-acetyltransferase [Azospirillum picis]MDQ0534075.1 RimJ/RimL family protein N-acetyltransferase [Azospirillum picis]